MARREFPLCPVCGAWSPAAPGACGHPPDPRFTWLRPPWWDGLGDLLSVTALALLLAAVLIGLGPLIWWLFGTWPPESAIDIFFAICLILVSLPNLFVSVGLVLAIPEAYRGRGWRLHDAAASDDDRAEGLVFVRVRAPVRGGVTRTVTRSVVAPVLSDMSSQTAAATGDLRLVVAAALVGLLARGRIALSLVEKTGWSLHPREPALRGRSTAVHARHLSPETSADLWLERRLLDRLAPRAVELRDVLRALVRDLAHEVGYVEDDHSARPYWPADAPDTPSEELRAVFFEDPPPLADPAPLAAALDEWRARDPEAVGLVLDLVTDLVTELDLPPDAHDHHEG